MRYYDASTPTLISCRFLSNVTSFTPLLNSYPFRPRPRSYSRPKCHTATANHSNNSSSSNSNNNSMASKLSNILLSRSDILSCNQWVVFYLHISECYKYVTKPRIPAYICITYNCIFNFTPICTLTLTSILTHHVCSSNPTMDMLLKRRHPLQSQWLHPYGQSIRQMTVIRTGTMPVRVSLRFDRSQCISLSCLLCEILHMIECLCASDLSFYFLL